MWTLWWRFVYLNPKSNSLLMVSFQLHMVSPWMKWRCSRITFKNLKQNRRSNHKNKKRVTEKVQWYYYIYVYTVCITIYTKRPLIKIIQLVIILLIGLFISTKVKPNSLAIVVVEFLQSLKYSRASIKYLSPSVIIHRLFSHIFTHNSFPLQTLQHLHHPFSFSTFVLKLCHSSLFMCVHLSFQLFLQLSHQTPTCTSHHKATITLSLLCYIGNMVWPKALVHVEAQIPHLKSETFLAWNDVVVVGVAQRKRGIELVCIGKATRTLHFLAIVFVAWGLWLSIFFSRASGLCLRFLFPLKVVFRKNVTEKIF